MTADVTDLLAGVDAPALRSAVLGWFDASGRAFPFRGLTDPYLILVSETILQQTQVSRGAPAWGAFVERFPTVDALAAASRADVLRAWRGLGYNRRALNLQRAARIVVTDHGGRFPADVATLERLPGIGPYTARAVAAIAFGLPVGAVDTNVRRVLGRTVAGDPAALTARELQAVADALVPADRPADWTHALMDVGSTRCRPAAPDCDACPARPFCRFARAHATRPRRARARRVRAIREGPADPPFASTRRWLRGRILDRLREAPDGAWVTFGGPLGDHDGEAVEAALVALARDGLLELRSPAGPVVRSSADAPASNPDALASSAPPAARLPLD